MSGVDWLAVALLAGAVIIDVAIDQLRERIARRRHDAYERDSHHRLMHEIRRLP
jgi:hypothetical protein